MLKIFERWFGQKNSPVPDEQIIAEPEPPEEDVQYALDFLHELTRLEHELHGSGDPNEIAMGALQAGCEFYQAEWCGILDVDMDLGVFTPYWWYTPVENDRTTELFREIEFAEGFPRWVDVLKSNDVIIVPDIEQIRNTYPEEYESYKRLEVGAVIGAPYMKRSIGFVAVKNPKRYKEQAEFLKMISYVVVAEVNERKLMERSNIMVPPEQLLAHNDVLIKLFGNLEIYTYKGKMKEDDLKSPKGCRVLVYLLLNRHRSMSSRELVDSIWPEEESDSAVNNIRSLLYRLRQNTEILLDEGHLIETTTNGYQLNSSLNITTDCMQFDEYCVAAENVSGVDSKIELLKKAVALYRGSLFSSATAETWLIPFETQYHMKYISIMNELLGLIDRTDNHSELYQYSVMALAVEQNNADFWYWNLHALFANGSSGMAKREMESARAILSVDDYSKLLERLGQK